MLGSLGAKTIQIRRPEQLKECDGLIIPGGESTVMSTLIDQYDLRKPIVDFAQQKPILGTCAGAILLSRNSNDPKVNPLGLMDISIQRNAYGRQIFSFSAPIEIEGFLDKYEAVFIRAPQFTLPPYEAGSREIAVLATHKNKPVMVRQKNILALAFHPELTNDARIHNSFLVMTKQNNFA
jgi:5'-phosphate synthase pdxT subunit